MKYDTDNNLNYNMNFDEKAEELLENDTANDEIIKKRFAKYNKLLLIHMCVCPFIMIPTILLGIFSSKPLFFMFLFGITFLHLLFTIVYFVIIKQACTCPFCKGSLGRNYYTSVCPKCGRRIKP